MAAPFTARLSASLPLPVNTTSSGRAPTNSATCSRASSSAVFAARDAPCAPDGLPGCSERNGSIAATAPLPLVFVTVGGVAGAAALALVGACVVGTFGVTMVMSQEYLPQQIGLASGLSIGMSIGLGGVAAVALGALADTVDLRTSLYVCAAVPVAAVALAAFLPSSRATRRLAPEAIQT